MLFFKILLFNIPSIFYSHRHSRTPAEPFVHPFLNWDGTFCPHLSKLDETFCPSCQNSMGLCVHVTFCPPRPSPTIYCTYYGIPSIKVAGEQSKVQVTRYDSFTKTINLPWTNRLALDLWSSASGTQTTCILIRWLR